MTARASTKDKFGVRATFRRFSSARSARPRPNRVKNLSYVEHIVSGLKANTAKFDWVKRNANDEITFLSIAEMISYFGDLVEKEAKQCNFRSVNTDVDLEQKIKESKDLITK